MAQLLSPCACPVVNMPTSEDLPYCAGCLQDFTPAQAPCALICGHLYCLSCLPRLTDSHGSYKCLLDGSLSSEGTVHCDIELGHSLERLKNGQEVNREVVSRAYNSACLQQVMCRVTFKGEVCTLGENCRFSHTERSMKIAQRFNVAVPAPCWECQNCLLTISHCVMKCPVCDCERDEQLKVPQTRPSIREMKSGTNVTLDQSLITEEERPKLQLIPLSLSEQMSPIAEAIKHEEPVRSSCCLLQ